MYAQDWASKGGNGQVQFLIWSVSSSLSKYVSHVSVTNFGIFFTFWHPQMIAILTNLAIFDAFKYSTTVLYCITVGTRKVCNTDLYRMVETFSWEEHRFIFENICDFPLFSARLHPFENSNKISYCIDEGLAYQEL